MALLLLARRAAGALLLLPLLGSCTYRNAETALPAPGTPGGPPACDTAAVTYARTVAPLLAQNCTGCHNAAQPAGGVNLQGVAQAQAYARNGALVGTIGHLPGYRPMPQNAPRLSACELAKVKIWVRSGAPNN